MSLVNLPTTRVLKKLNKDFLIFRNEHTRKIVYFLAKKDAEDLETGVKVSDVLKHLNISKSSMTQYINHLENQGYITKFKKGRSVYVYLNAVAFLNIMQWNAIYR